MVNFVFLTERGKRENNEDYYGNYKDELFIVADGLGGHPAGEVAAKVAVESAIASYKLSKDKNSHQVLEKIFQKANTEILERSNEKKDWFGMGTTMVAAQVKKREVVVGNVGDSLAYLFSGDRLELVSKEERDVMGSLVTALGIDAEIEPYLTERKLKLGDTIVLCTDGLTDFVEEGLVEKILKSSLAIQKKVNGLIEAAAKLGSTDNITVGLIKI